MAKTTPQRQTREKIALFRRCFTGLPNVYGTYDPRSGRARQVKQRVSDGVVLAHLQGRQPYGVYLLTHDTTRAVVVDFDDNDPADPLGFLRQAEHYGITPYLERSKTKGFHTWVFLELPGVLAKKARLVVHSILREIDMPAMEVFPRQDRLDHHTSFGNFINAPLFGELVSQGRTVFVDPSRGLAPFANQWDVLEGVQRVSELHLDEVIGIKGLALTRNPPESRNPSPTSPAIEMSFGLPPCARRILAEGVTEYQRVACFRLATHLRKAGIPQDVAIAALVAWAGKNHPKGGQRIITRPEICEQTTCAYAKSYRGCGCEEPAIKRFCHAGCPVNKGRGGTAVREEERS